VPTVLPPIETLGTHEELKVSVRRGKSVPHRAHRGGPSRPPRPGVPGRGFRDSSGS